MATASEGRVSVQSWHGSAKDVTHQQGTKSSTKVLSFCANPREGHSTMYPGNGVKGLDSTPCRVPQALGVTVISSTEISSRRENSELVNTEQSYSTIFSWSAPYICVFICFSVKAKCVYGKLFQNIQLEIHTFPFCCNFQAWTSLLNVPMFFCVIFPDARNFSSNVNNKEKQRCNSLQLSGFQGTKKRHFSNLKAFCLPKSKGSSWT